LITHARLKRRSFTALLLAAPFVFATPQGQIDTGIGIIGGIKPIRMAVSELKFAGDTSVQMDRLAKAFNDTLWADLDFAGTLDLASRSFYPLGTFALPGHIKPEEWAVTGAQYIAYGNLSLNPAANRFNAAAYLRDIATGTDPISIVFPGDATEEDARRAAHRFADRILETLGLGQGITQTRIAFVSSRSGFKEIYVMDYDGRNQRKLTNIGDIAIAPNWSPVPGDDRIAYMAWRATGRQIEILSASGDPQPRFQQSGSTNGFASWSPDGKSIVYSSHRDGDTEIYWANADGSDAKRLTNSRGIDTSPNINPATGRQIAFISTRGGSPELYTMDSDGAGVQRITDEGGDVQNPAYSPDGSMIAFAWQKPRSGSFDIYVYDIRMRKFTQLTSGSGSNERPSWAPDGKHIAFTSTRRGTSQIYAMTVDGKKVLQLTNSTGINEGATWSGYAAR
jgi:TolB protein